MSLSKEKMIKAIEVIKMRKDIKHLIDKYFFSKSLLAEALEVCPKVISDLIDKEVMPQDDKFILLLTKLDMIKQQIKEAEEYQPG
tara:strand:- start:64 stop:318 length:255 start_codon:yes stop_codon:yes gene_type:complete